MVERQQIRSELNAFGRPSRHFAVGYGQRYPTRVTLNSDDMESQIGNGTTLMRWDVLKHREKVDGLGMVLGDAMVGFCARMSATHPKTASQFRAFPTARLGPPDG